MEVYHTYIRVALPTSAKPLWRLSHRHAQMLFSWLTLNPAMLVIQLNSHTPFSPHISTGFSGFDSYSLVASIPRSFDHIGNTHLSQWTQTLKTPGRKQNTQTETQHKGSACKEIFKVSNFTKFLFKNLQDEIAIFLHIFSLVEALLFAMEKEKHLKN